MRALGIEIIEEGYRIALVRRAVEGYRVLYAEETSSLECLGDPMIISALGDPTLVCRVSMPRVRPRAIAAALPFQLEPQLPLPLDEALISHQLVDDQVSATIARRTDVAEHLKNLNNLPEQVSTPAAALAALLDYLRPSELPQALIYGSLFVVVQKGSVLAARIFAPEEEAKTAAAFASLGYEQIFHIDESILDSPFSLECADFAAIPIGLAIAALQGRGLNLRPRPIFPWRRLRLPLLRYAFASLLAAAACFTYAHARQHNAEKLIHAELAGVGVKTLEEARVLHAQLSRVHNPFPLEPRLPLAGEFLSWLVHHPQAQSLQVQDLRYALVKRPTFQKPRERYEVRIDLEFTAPSATAARAFHDALLADMKEVKWSAQRERYRATFFLPEVLR